MVQYVVAGVMVVVMVTKKKVKTVRVFIGDDLGDFGGKTSPHFSVVCVNI
jgi:hypothetical protein